MNTDLVVVGVGVVGCDVARELARWNQSVAVHEATAVQWAPAGSICCQCELIFRYAGCVTERLDASRKNPSLISRDVSWRSKTKRRRCR